MRRGISSLSLSGTLAFSGPIAVYLVTLSPGVDFWDIGEMQTVPYVLGIAHPTGFPLFVLLGFLVSHLVPFATPAVRISLMCAVAVALAAYALFTIVRALVDDERIALAVALAFACGDIVWTRAIRADVHDLALAAIAFALARATDAGLARSPRALAFAALAIGCGIATHPIAALMLPSVLILAWPAIAAAPMRARVGALALAALPSSAYAYVPLRSAYIEARGLDPALALGVRGGAIFDTGSPSMPASFWRYVTGADFSAGGALTSSLSPGGVAHAALFARATIFREYGLVMLAFALVGALVLALTRPRIALAFALVASACAGFAANFAAESDVARYAMPGLWVVAACSGVGAAWLASSLFAGATARARVLAIAPFVVVAAILPMLGAAARDVARVRSVDDARAYATAIASHTVDGSLVVATWTFATPLFYEAYVANAFGTRHVLSGWPTEFRGRYAAWRARYKHVYFVLGASDDVAPFATPRFRSRTWRLSELRR